MIQVDGVGVVSAGDTFFSNSLANAALFVFRRDPSALILPVSMAVGPVVGQDIIHIYTSALSYQDHLAEEVSVRLQSDILAFHSGCLCADC